MLNSVFEVYIKCSSYKLVKLMLVACWQTLNFHWWWLTFLTNSKFPPCPHFSIPTKPYMPCHYKISKNFPLILAHHPPKLGRCGPFDCIWTPHSCYVFKVKSTIESSIITIHVLLHNQSVNGQHQVHWQKPKGSKSIGWCYITTLKRPSSSKRCILDFASP
jgi:hypothetical protein